MRNVKSLLNRSGKNPLDSVNCIVSKIEFLEMQSEVQNVFVSDDMARYIVSLISATRRHPLLSRGASPRATLSLTDMAKAVAFAEGRDYIVPRDVQNIFICTVNHRIILNAKASASKKEQRRNSARNSQKNSKTEDLKMIRNIIIYLCLLTGTFLFSIFYYAWFSWFLFLTVVSIPIISLLLSLPFMIRVYAPILKFLQKKMFLSRMSFTLQYQARRKNRSSALCSR